jgi:hypothetical protein
LINDPEPPEGGSAMTIDNATRAPVVNGRAGVDPAHDGGPLPQATLPELVGRLINDVSDLADRQIDLAKQEIGEARDDVVDAGTRVAIGVGVVLVSALLLTIWAWTAFIWFFNWLFGFISFPTPFGQQSLAWVGWLLGVLVPAAAAWLAYKRFIRPGIDDAMEIWPPLPLTRASLRESLEWVRNLRTPQVR